MSEFMGLIKGSYEAKKGVRIVLCWFFVHGFCGVTLPVVLGVFARRRKPTQHDDPARPGCGNI